MPITKMAPTKPDFTVTKAWLSDGWAEGGTAGCTVSWETKSAGSGRLNLAYDSDDEPDEVEGSHFGTLYRLHNSDGMLILASACKGMRDDFGGTNKAFAKEVLAKLVDTVVTD